MRAAKNMAELEKMILDKMTLAMSDAHQRAKQDTEKEVMDFYSQGKPRLYKRTGKLGKSTKSYGTFKGAKSVSFVVWLDRTYTYDMPNMLFIKRGLSSYFTTPMVFDAAESGTAKIKGKSGFWSRSVEKIKKDTDDALSKYFSKI